MIPPKALLLGLFVAALQPAVASSSAHVEFSRPTMDGPVGSNGPSEVVPIPEPTSAVLGLMAAAAILLRRRFS